MPKKVLIAMSGGVDSAVAALLLKEQGYDVTGVTLQLLTSPATEKAIDDARQTADTIGIPHLAVDMRQAFDDSVIRYFQSEYENGRTPNPCVRCNASVKLGLLYHYAMQKEFDFLATGHYARVVNNGDDCRAHLFRGKDAKKDQSYMLCKVPEFVLQRTLFPLGDLDKPAVRTMAEAHGFVSAAAKESQDICFVPDGDYTRFLTKERGVFNKAGNFTDTAGNVIGKHDGCIRFTTGQRKGLGMGFGKPMFVLRKDTKSGDVTLGEEEELFSSGLIAADINWLCNPHHLPDNLTAKVRYSQKDSPVTVTPRGTQSSPYGATAMVEFTAPQRAITTGQFVAFYHGDELLGGGTIEKIL